jgi:hypothetical protein
MNDIFLPNLAYFARKVSSSQRTKDIVLALKALAKHYGFKTGSALSVAEILQNRRLYEKYQVPGLPWMNRVDSKVRYLVLFCSGNWAYRM